MSHTYEFSLEGPSIHGDRQDGALLRDLLSVLVDGSRRAARFAIEGRSFSAGPTPAWVQSAGRLEMLSGVRLDHLRFVAPTLREALPQFFEQEPMLPEEEVVNPERTALDYFGDGLQDAIAGSLDSDRYDDGLVRVFEELGEVFAHGVDRIRWLNGHSFDVVPSGVESVGRLRKQTPKDQAARVAGTLNTIRHSDRKFELVQPSGGVIRGVAEETDALRELFGKKVVATGTLKFKPSGSVLRVEAAHLALANEGELRVLGVPPRPWRTPVEIPAARVPQGARSGLNALVGTWPGNETDEEFAALVRAVS